jgi:ubiquinone/menaquinone biosynthesis C-methylase UbiE
MIKDRLSIFIRGQFRKPSGLFGRLIGNRMAQGNTFDASWTVSLLNIEPDSRILEIGFGPGVSTQYAAEKASKGFVAGIDHSETMVQAARRRNAAAVKAGRMDLKQGDVASLPYPDESFDKAFSIHSIYFWAKPDDCLKELRRVLKPGGLLATTILPKDKWGDRQSGDASLWTLYFGADLARMYSEAGLRDVRVEASPEPDKFPGECVLGVK